MVWPLPQVFLADVHPLMPLLLWFLWLTEGINAMPQSELQVIKLTQNRKCQWSLTPGQRGSGFKPKVRSLTCRDPWASINKPDFPVNIIYFNNRHTLSIALDEMPRLKYVVLLVSLFVCHMMTTSMQRMVISYDNQSLVMRSLLSCLALENRRSVDVSRSNE